MDIFFEGSWCYNIWWVFEDENSVKANFLLFINFIFLFYSILFYLFFFFFLQKCRSWSYIVKLYVNIWYWLLQGKCTSRTDEVWVLRQGNEVRCCVGLLKKFGCYGWWRLLRRGDEVWVLRQGDEVWVLHQGARWWGLNIASGWWSLGVRNGWWNLPGCPSRWGLIKYGSLLKMFKYEYCIRSM